MKISKVAVQRGKSITLENNNSENFEVQMEALIEEKDDPEDIIQGLKSILDRHLLAWEQKIHGYEYETEEPKPVTIKTAEELIQPISQGKTKTKELPGSEQEGAKSEAEQMQLICPKCNEVMVKKDGKDYYLCSKHWGYPDMIKAGNVREKKF